MANGNGLHFTLSLPSVDDVAVVDFTHREALSRPFELTLNVASRQGQLHAAELLDRDATLTVWQNGEALRQVNGIVSEFSQGDRGHRRTFYSLVLRPALWRLSLRHNSRIFQHVTPIDIITTLCQERGMSDITFEVAREPIEREYCVQYRETDLAFIERLAAEEGLFYYHTFESGTHRLIFSDDPTRLNTLGERTYHSRAGEHRPCAMCVNFARRRGWPVRPPRSRITPSRTPGMHSCMRIRAAMSSSTDNGPTMSTTTTQGVISRMLPASRLPARDWNICVATPSRPTPKVICPSWPRGALYAHRPRYRSAQSRLATDRGHPLRRTASSAGRRQHLQ